MRILHYFLGFPPYRSGGLTKFAYDLMISQVEDNNDVIALWPGEIRKIGGKPSIKPRRNVYNIINYEIINPLPVSLDEGIKDIEAYTASVDKKIFVDFLNNMIPDVIHIHTLMGLHSEFIEAAKQLKIRTVYTSHDYFGLCPKVTLFRQGECCDDDKDCERCVQCNITALSLNKVQIMQSPLYRRIKNSLIVKILRKRHRNSFFAEEQPVPELEDIELHEVAQTYRELRSFYKNIYEQIDVIHFNSSVARNIFHRYITPNDEKIISITHRGIENHVDTQHIKCSDKLQILCLAPAKPYKGFVVLKKALDNLWNNDHREFELRLFGPVENREPYMVVEEAGYEYSELPSILSKADVLVAPSVWYETFGFTVLEALSYGVPVIVSDHVGAKDIVGDCGIIVNAFSTENIENAILKLDKDFLQSIRRNIQSHAQIKLWVEFKREMYELYQK